MTWLLREDEHGHGQVEECGLCGAQRPYFCGRKPYEVRHSTRCPLQPTPGSAEATRLGCRCATMDNHYGVGYRGQAGVFAITGGCPLHAP